MAGIGPHLKGHILLFDRRPQPRPDAATSVRLLLVFLLLEYVLGPRLHVLGWLHLPVPPQWIRMPALIVVALLLVRFDAAIAATRAWGERPDAAFWFARCWAEGIRR